MSRDNIGTFYDSLVEFKIVMFGSSISRKNHRRAPGTPPLKKLTLGVFKLHLKKSAMSREELNDKYLSDYSMDFGF